MAQGVRGRLVSSAFADAWLASLSDEDAPPPHILRALDTWAGRREASLGPASSARAIADVAAVPLLKILGYTIDRRRDVPGQTALEAVTPSRAIIPVVVVQWNESLERTWRSVVIDGIRSDARWGFCTNGASLRIVDGRQTWSRHYLEFNLAFVPGEPQTAALLWALARADAMTAEITALERASAQSARHGAAVCEALGSGVLHALALLMTALAPAARDRPLLLYDQSLTVLYRVLFLLFAEARGLVPMWHPIYRDRYTIEAILATLLGGRPCRGIWHAVVAISRLAHAGCSAGELKVTPFNGRLFAPTHAAAFDRTRIDDGVMAGAILAIGTTAGRAGRTRISYRDLDVEQLGAVYERVLDYEPVGAGAHLARTGDARRSSGSFYTPRAVTAYLVRCALEPLVRDRTADEIMCLRILDPAMGSGAFLVAACRFLASAVEERLIVEGRWHEGDVDASDRAAVRREIAQRCLFGVDLNPMAVQLARLSIWLVSLASDKPLTFLDHHLVAGNSLIGASLDDVRRQPPGGVKRTRRPQSLPLFSGPLVGPILQDAVRARLKLTRDPDDSPDRVHGKETTLAALHAPHSPLGRWSSVLDMWCAGWFWEKGEAPNPALFNELSDSLIGEEARVPSRTAAAFLDDAAAIAARHRFLHWRLAFPEVFQDDNGEPRPDGGFDAVIGNPPWDMVRGDSGDVPVRSARRIEARQLTDFAREAGIYRVESRVHVNRYQLFLERALQLTRPGGRVGLVLPSGVVTDPGASALRRHLFNHADVDTVTGLDNRGGIFPIHRSLRFALLTATVGRPTRQIACRFGIRTAAELDDLDARPPLAITRPLVARISGADDLGIPEMAAPRDLQIVERIASRVPSLADPDGWNVRFGRELNASDDSAAFVPCADATDARPVLEGKQVEPFRAHTSRCRFAWVEGDDVRIPRRARIAYRDIASATNRLTLIAAIVPSRAVTTHTLFCLKTPLPADAQHVLCALLNSFVANYLIRMRVNTHVTVALVSRLRIPFVRAEDEQFRALAALSHRLASGAGSIEETSEYPELQAMVAKLYGLTSDEFEHVLGTFPLVSEEARQRALTIFRNRS
jgi:hypothetical protein